MAIKSDENLAHWWEGLTYDDMLVIKMFALWKSTSPLYKYGNNPGLLPFLPARKVREALWYEYAGAKDLHTKEMIKDVLKKIGGNIYPGVND